MLTKTQLLLLTLMATLGGSFAALMVIGIFSGDFTFAAYNLIFIVAMFCAVFTFCGKDRRKCKFYDDSTPMRRSTDLHIGGEGIPEFQADLLESVRQMKAGKAARTHKASINMM